MEGKVILSIVIFDDVVDDSEEDDEGHLQTEKKDKRENRKQILIFRAISYMGCNGGPGS